MGFDQLCVCCFVTVSIYKLLVSFKVSSCIILYPVACYNHGIVSSNCRFCQVNESKSQAHLWRSHFSMESANHTYGILMNFNELSSRI